MVGILSLNFALTNRTENLMKMESGFSLCQNRVNKHKLDGMVSRQRSAQSLIAVNISHKLYFAT